MKKFIFFSIFIILLSSNYSCLGQSIALTMQEKLLNSTHIIEGQVIGQKCFYQNDKIYTKNKIKVINILKGEKLTQEISILTYGGTIDGITMTRSHNFSLKKDEKGILFIRPMNGTSENREDNYFEVYSGRQGFYKREFDGQNEKISTFLSSFASMDSFKKAIGIDYDVQQYKNDLYVADSSEYCLNYRLEPLSSFENGVRSNVFEFNLYVSSQKMLQLRELNLFLNYDQSWFGSNIVNQGNIQFTNGEFDSQYLLNTTDISSQVIQISLTSTSSTPDLQIISDSEILVCSFSVNIQSVSFENSPLLLENTSYHSELHNMGNAILNNCGEIEIRGTCGVDITKISVTKNAGDGSILRIEGSGFVDDVTPDDNCDPMPNSQHYVLFSSISGSKYSRIRPLEGDYKTWQDDLIEVRVPTEGYVNKSNVRANPEKDEIAATGRITVCIRDWGVKCYCGDTSGETDNKPTHKDQKEGELYVPFSTYSADNADNGNYDPETDCLNSRHCRLINKKRKISFNINALGKFDGAKDAFIRALNTWRCKININFDISSDGIPVSFGKVGDQEFGHTDLLFGTCPVDNQKWTFPTAMVFRDIDYFHFSESVDIPDTRVDFQSRALHEIGHAMGLIHTNNIDDVMLPGTGLGEESLKRTIHMDDCSGGAFCKSQSTSAFPCTVSNPLNSLEGPCEISTTTDLNNLEANTFSVYPNPVFNNVFNLELDDIFLKKYNIEIYDINGKIVFTKKGYASKIKIALVNKPKGIYFIRIRSQNNSITKKITLL